MTSKRPDELRLDRLATPIGEALIVTDEEGYLRAFDWAGREAAMARLLRLHYGSLAPRPGAAPADMMRRLRHYFDGDIAGLAPIPWRTAGTPFQRRVWGGLTTIAPGTTLSYGALAAQLGCASAIRAVGRANGSNPISVVVPCHRVIGADGTLTAMAAACRASAGSSSTRARRSAAQRSVANARRKRQSGGGLRRSVSGRRGQNQRLAQADDLARARIIADAEAAHAVGPVFDIELAGMGHDVVEPGQRDLHGVGFVVVDDAEKRQPLRLNLGAEGERGDFDLGLLADERLRKAVAIGTPIRGIELSRRHGLSPC